MRSKRLGFRTLGVCLALAGVMAVGVGSVQAEVGAKWLVEGKAVTSELKGELTGALEGNHGQLLAEIGGIGIHILCTGATVVKGGSVLVEGGILGALQLQGCKILRLKGGVAEPLTACTPPGGLITTALSKGLLTLHKLASGAVDTVMALEPDTGTTFTTINTGEECAFGEQIQIGGKVAVIDTEASVSKVTHLIKEFAPLTELYINGNKANKATIDGSGEVKLAGPHAGLKWSGDPAEQRERHSAPSGPRRHS